MAMKFHLDLRPFSHEDTTFLKGIAILLIVLHNYYRWVIPSTGENEFWFNPLAINRSWIFLRGNPLEFFHVFFSFLGHYGVQAFIVISAYGLTLSYQKSRPAYGRFILHRFDKLYPSLILAGIGFILVTLFTTGKLIGMETLKELGIQFTLFANLIPGKAMLITGPWWFYSFIFGFYLVFPLLMWIRRRTGWRGLAGLAVSGYLYIIFLYKPLDQANLNPYMTVMGHLPEICMGIFLATRDKVRLPWWVLLLAVVILVTGNIYRWAWPFANLSAALILLVSIRGLTGMKTRIKGFYPLVSAIGVISMYLFAVHGYLRSPFVGLANMLGNSIASILIGALFVTVACGLAFLGMQTEQAARGWIGSSGSNKIRAARLSFLVFLVAGGFAFLFIRAYIPESKTENLGEVITFEASHDFESPIPGRNDHYSDSIAFKGEMSLVLDDGQGFSPGFEVGFDSVNVKDLFEVEISAWLFSFDPSSGIHLVMEIWDKPSGIRIEWQSEYIRPETYQTGAWLERTFHYSIPPELCRSNYLLKVYAWKPSEGTWFIDDLVVRLKAKKKI